MNFLFPMVPLKIEHRENHTDHKCELVFEQRRVKFTTATRLRPGLESNFVRRIVLTHGKHGKTATVLNRSLYREIEKANRMRPNTSLSQQDIVVRTCSGPSKQKLTNTSVNTCRYTSDFSTKRFQYSPHGYCLHLL